MGRIKRVAKWAGALLSFALVAIQFVPVERSNPPVESEVPASPAARAVLRRACYDCHSNETVWARRASRACGHLAAVVTIRMRRGVLPVWCAGGSSHS